MPRFSSCSSAPGYGLLVRRRLLELRAPEGILRSSAAGAAAALRLQHLILQLRGARLLALLRPLLPAHALQVLLESRNVAKVDPRQAI